MLKLKLKFPIGIILTVTIASIFTSSCIFTNKKSTSSFITNKSQYLSGKTIDILNNKIKLLVDDNFHILKNIIIIDRMPKTEKGAESFFDEKSNQIFFSTKRLKTFKLDYPEHRAEYIFQIIFHEYNHFLNSIYLNNLHTNDSQRDETIFEFQGKERVPEIWNKYFLNKFKEELKYDKSTPLYNAKPILNNFVSIGSKYNQKELFDIANGKSEPIYKNLSGNEVMAPLQPKVMVDSKHIILGGALSYLFSMQELVARKIQVVNYKYIPNIINNQGFDQNGFLVNKNKTWISPYLQDIVNFKRELNSNKGIYLNDVPDISISKLYDSYIHNPSQVNEIHFKNNITKEEINGSYIGKIDKTLISFSGIFQQKTEIGYLKNGNFISLPVSWKKINNKWAYHVSKYIHVKDIKDKFLAFKQNNNVQPMKEVRSGVFGDVTTYKVWDKNFLNTNLKVYNETSGLVIRDL